MTRAVLFQPLADPAAHAAALAFIPVPRRNKRHDGWTPRRQRDFIAALADTGSVKDACRAVGMASEGAYILRRAEGAESFAAAWEAALEIGAGTLLDIAMERVRHGIEVPVFWRGEQCGVKRWHDNRLLMFLLRHRLPGKFGALAGVARSREAEELDDEPTIDEVSEEIVARIAALKRHRLAEDPALAFAPTAEAQRIFKASIAHDPARRAAWELLMGPEDWDAVAGDMPTPPLGRETSGPASEGPPPALPPSQPRLGWG